MAFEAISTGLRPNDGLGDPPKVVGEKLNRMLTALFAGLENQAALIAELQAQIAAGGLNAATLENTLITAGIPVDHVQGLASEIITIVTDLTAIGADLTALAARFTALEG